MRTFILLSLTTSLFACQEQEPTQNIEDIQNEQQLDDFEDYTSSLEASPNDCIYGGEINGSLDENTLNIVDVELSWNPQDLKSPNAIPSPGSSWEKSESKFQIR